LLSYGVPVWIDALRSPKNANRLKQVQRLMNIKITKAFRTTSHEALCILSGTTPINIELTARTKLCNIKRGRLEHNPVTTLDLPINYEEWPHPAEDIEAKTVTEDETHTVHIYTDGSKPDAGSAQAYTPNEPVYKTG
jgi:hypothetical protein